MKKNIPTSFRSKLFISKIPPLFIGLFFIINLINGQNTKIKLNYNWKFKAGENSNANQAIFNDNNWRVLDLPHDWSIEGKYAENNPSGGRCGYLPTGIVWYRKDLQIPKDWNNKEISIEFDSVFMNSTVWINGVQLGKRPYGYVSFAYNLTPHLQSEKNTIAVRIDNTLQPSGRWYTGTGIFGNVYLSAKENIHIKRGGIFFQTLQSNTNQATLQIDSEIVSKKEVLVTNQLINNHGEIVSEIKSTTKNKKVTQLINILKPKLWTIENPHLYTLKTIVFHKGRKVDEEATQIGIRSIRFDTTTGFYLNDVPLKMQGVCEHHDGGPLGGAFPKKILRERLLLLKEMGVNAIRTAHNPRTQEFYQLCNEIGLMVMDEVFDGWHKKAEADYGGRYFKKWWKTDVEEWIKTNRNHPCIVMYSIGNETGKEDTYNISNYIKKFDKTRPTTGGTLFKGVDIQGYNGPGGKPGSMQEFHEKFPNKICVRTEVPHTLQTRGFYRVKTWWRDKKKERNDIPEYGKKQLFFDGHPRYSSSYDNCGVRISARTSWKETRDMPWIIGEFRWTGFDYIGEASFSNGKWPARIWNFGVIDLAGLPKDHFWFYQSQWTKKPMVHILPHWTHRFLKPDTIVPIVGYSNCEEVELFLNGVSLGRKKEDEKWLEFLWKVPYKPGTLKAIGYINNKPVTEKIWNTATAPISLKLDTNNNQLKADREDTATITFSAEDKDGNNVPWCMNNVEFNIEGPIKHLGFENGDPIDITSHRINHRKLFYGKAKGFFQATNKNAPIEITAAAILGDTLFENTELIAIDYKKIMLRGQLPSANYTIKYSLNGQNPLLYGKKYNNPFTIDKTTFIKAVLLKNNTPLIHIEQKFTKGLKPKISDPRFTPGYYTNNESKFKGPYDKEIIGLWKNKKDIYEFKKNGKLYKNDLYGNKVIAYWWYDYPNDIFEADGNTGNGALKLIKTKLKGNITMKLKTQKALKLFITYPNGSIKTFTKVLN